MTAHGCCLSESHHESVWFLLLLFFATQRPTTVCRTWRVTPSSRSPRSAGAILSRCRWERWCPSLTRFSTTSTPSSVTFNLNRSVHEYKWALTSTLWDSSQSQCYQNSSWDRFLWLCPGAHVLRGSRLYDRGPDRSGCTRAPDRKIHAAAQSSVGQHHPAGHEGKGLNTWPNTEKCQPI